MASVNSNVALVCLHVLIEVSSYLKVALIDYGRISQSNVHKNCIRGGLDCMHVCNRLHDKLRPQGRRLCNP